MLRRFRGELDLVSSWRRAFRWKASLLLLPVILSAGLGGSGARAQTFDTRTEGISAGRFLLYPSLTMEYTEDSNIFYRTRDLGAANVIASGVVVLRPRILVDLPLGASRIRWVYSPLYRDYETDRFRQGKPLSHFFDFEGLYRNGRGMTLAVRDHLIRGSIELQQVDRGGELTFGLTPFEIHEPSLEMSLDFAGRQGVSLIPRYSSVSFKNATDTGLYDYQRSQVESRYSYHLSPSDTLYAYFTFDRTNQQRDLFVSANQAVVSRVAGLGLTRTLNQAVISRASAGYQRLEFERSSSRGFEGLVLDVGTYWSLSDITRMDITVRRQAYQSFFANVNFYVDNLIGLRLLHQAGSNLYWSVGATYQRNVYGDRVDVAVIPQMSPGQDVNGNGLVDAFESYLPSQGIRRRDSVVSLTADVGWQLVRTLRVSLGYNFDERRANIGQRVAGEILDPFDYRVQRVTFRIEAGWM